MRNKIFLYILSLISLICYIIIGYLTPRTSFFQLTGMFGCLFVVYVLIIYKWRDEYKLLTAISVVFRFSLLFSIPSLSDDFYRFIWDGTLFMSGENPFLHLPDYYINNPINTSGITIDLYEKLNSPHYFTIYPPVCQYIFLLACKINPGSIAGSVMVMKAIVFLSEIGSIILIGKLLKMFNLPGRNILFYTLNPLVIIELTGNLHFEVIMIFFLLCSVYLLVKTRSSLSAVCFGFAVGAKFLPLIFLPFLIKRIGLKRSIVFCGVTGLVVLILFIPFFSKDLVRNLFSSIDLYFQKFEFNASIYYLVRWIGYKVYGYNIIANAGLILGILTFITLVIYALREKHVETLHATSLHATSLHALLTLPRSMLFALTIYLALATIVHPWYITPLIAFSVFTKFRYAIVWSFVIILSYSTYQSETYYENLMLVGIEYLIVVGWMILEHRKIVSSQ